MIVPGQKSPDEMPDQEEAPASGEKDPAGSGKSPPSKDGESAGEAIRLPIEDAIDLHTFHPRDIRDVVTDYLWEAAKHGFSEVRIIHGKGTGYQKEVVTKILESHPAVESFTSAPAERGHWGATVARLGPVN